MDNLVLELQSLVIRNQARIDALEEISARFETALEDITARFETIGLSTRTRTITPVPEEKRCSQILVSGKNKGGRCSKKSTVGSLCTMHNKKITSATVFSTLSDEFVPDYILDQESSIPV
jgi:hypothetical protein